MGFSEKRRKPRRKPFASQKNLAVHLGAVQGAGLEAKVIDFGGGGLRLELKQALEKGTTVTVTGEIDGTLGRQTLQTACQVQWCIETGQGKFEVGVTFSAPDADPTSKEESIPLAGLDAYEILQLSRNADTDTVHRVFHMMAARYHPDNKETGNTDLFRQMVEAHETLSDPERRASLDTKLAHESKSRVHLFKSVEESLGVEAEIRKRQGILRLLYNKRLMDSRLPSLGARDLEELLGCPREHLEFNLWLLRESKLIVRSDNNRFEITTHGALAFENEERSQTEQTSSRTRLRELLPASVA